MGFWKSFFGGEQPSPEEEKKNAEERQFNLMKYDGMRALRMGQADYAEKCLLEALKVRDDLEVRDTLSQAYIRLGRLDEALEQLKHLTTLTNGHPQLLLRAAHVAYMLEDYEQMENFCKQTIDANPELAVAHYMMGQACKGKGDLVQAIAWLTKAIAQDENLSDARLLRCETLISMGDLNGAAEDCEWLLAHTEGQEDVLLTAARLAHAKGDDDRAIALYNQVNDVNPFQLDAYGERGRLHFDRGEKEAAEADMQKLLELNPDELSGVSGDYKAEGVEEQVKRAYSMMNPFGI